MTRLYADLPRSTAQQIAISALAGQGQYGMVSDLAEKYGVPRRTVYELLDQGRVAVEAAFAQDGGVEPGTITLQITERDIMRSLIAMRVATPSSIRDLVAVMPVLYGFGWSYGKIQSRLAEAERRADEFLRKVDLSRIEYAALDEMFSQGRPVFGGVDLDSQYLFQLEVHRHRGGEDWAKSLGKLRDEQNLSPRSVVKDAGSGLAKGVEDCWPDAEHRDDLFHAVYMMGQESYHLERRAYGAITRVDDLIAKSGRARSETARRSLGQKTRKARKHADHAIDRFDRFEALRYEAKRVLELTDPGSGKLRTPAEVQQVLTQVGTEMESLEGSRIRKVAKYLRNRAAGLGRYLDDLGQRLEAVTEEAGGRRVVQAALRAYQASLSAGRKAPAWERQQCKRELSKATDHLLKVTEGKPERVMRVMSLVVPVVQRRHRASSAIENLNSVLRPYLVVQKNVEQGFLDLFRFYWNTRKREWGRGKGTSPYEELTGEPVEDWLTLLGYPPSEAFTESLAA